MRDIFDDEKQEHIKKRIAKKKKNKSVITSVIVKKGS